LKKPWTKKLEVAAAEKKKLLKVPRKKPKEGHGLQEQPWAWAACVKKRLQTQLGLQVAQLELQQVAQLEL
jgi:hypothetical protein